MTKTNAQAIPSNFQHHDTPNNKTHVIKFRVTAEEKTSLELDKSYYMGLYFLYFNRHNIRKFVNILPVIFGR